MARWLGVSVAVVGVVAGGWLVMPLLYPREEDRPSLFPKLPALPEDEGGEEQGGFAAERGPDKAAKPVEFDGKRAMSYLEAVCDIGPRMSGTVGMAKQQQLITKHFEKLGA